MPSNGSFKFYAVYKGRAPGVYTVWDECEAQIKGFSGARYKKFENAADAETFVRDGEDSPKSSSSTKGSTSTTSRVTVSDDEPGWDVVYCDGACKGNGKVGSVAGIGVWWGPDDDRNLAERCPGDQTNNRAELIAIARVLETTPTSRRPLMIKSDSRYSINCLQTWIHSWRKNEFITNNGPVKNAPLIRYVSALLESRELVPQTVKLEYVKGHAGIQGNEGADHMANVGATRPSLPERDWEELTVQLKTGKTIKKAKITARSTISKVTRVEPEEIDWGVFQDCLLSDEELLRMAATGNFD